MKREEAERLAKLAEEKRIEDAREEYQRKKRDGEILTDAQKKKKEKDELMRKQLEA